MFNDLRQSPYIRVADDTIPDQSMFAYEILQGPSTFLRPERRATTPDKTNIEGLSQRHCSLARERYRAYRYKGK